MIATIWHKHWMELRGRWLLLVAIASVPGISMAFQGVAHPRPGHATVVWFSEVATLYAQGVSFAVLMVVLQSTRLGKESSQPRCNILRYFQR